jgi:MFS family permease
MIGYVTAVAMRPLIALAGAAWQVIGFRVVDRIGKGLRTPARDALIADVTPPAAHGRAFGFHRGADHFGAVLGSLVAWALLAQGVAVRDVIAASVLPGVIVCAVLAVVLREVKGRVPSMPAAAAGRPAVATGRVFWLPVLALAALTCFRLPEALLILRLQERGVSVAAIPLVWAGLHVVRSASSYPGGWLSDRLGPRRVIAAGGVLFALGAVALGAALDPVAAAAVFVSLGVVAGLSEAAERTVVAQLAPATLGRGFGAFHAVVGVGALPAGLGFGMLYQEISAAAALWGSAAAVLVAVLVWSSVGLRAARDRAAT